MGSDFLPRLLAKLCPHRFSWPHTGAHSRDYQVCLICGTAYEYDISTMQRTDRVMLPEAQVSPSQLPRGTAR